MHKTHLRAFVISNIFPGFPGLPLNKQGRAEGEREEWRMENEKEEEGEEG
jgi:hypothetical protein